MSATCHGCGGPLEPSRGGVPRKWCSERCRKTTLYGRPCPNCSKPMDGSNGLPGAPALCRACRFQKQHDEARWTPETIATAIREWAAVHGRYPHADEWRASGPNHPATSTVVDVMGWNTAIRAAGGEPVRRGHTGNRAGEDPAVLDETVRLYRAGMSARAVAEATGCSQTAVLYRLRKVGEPRRPARRPRTRAVEMAA